MARRALRSFSEGGLKGYGEFRHPFQDALRLYDNRWTRSIAVGGVQFVQKIKVGLGTKAVGRQIREVPRGYELRERVSSYIPDFSPQKGDIGLENTYNC